jgi:hypothetical protein
MKEVIDATEEAFNMLQRHPSFPIDIAEKAVRTDLAAAHRCLQEMHGERITSGQIALPFFRSLLIRLCHKLRISVEYCRCKQQGHRESFRTSSVVMRHRMVVIE